MNKFFIKIQGSWSIITVCIKILISHVHGFQYLLLFYRCEPLVQELKGKKAKGWLFAHGS